MRLTDGLSAVPANALRTGPDQRAAIMPVKEVRKVKCTSPREQIGSGFWECGSPGNFKTVDLPSS